MNIAIIGTGFSGLATGWFLLNSSSANPINITFFDPFGIGGGTSGMAGGLMHPHVGASAKLNINGLEGYLATSELLKLASEKIGKPVVKSHGLLRLAITEKQKQEFRVSSESYENVVWCKQEETIQKIPGLSIHPGIFIQKNVIVDCHLYLEGLWLACKEKGAKLEKATIHSIEELKGFDLIVLATGASVNKLLPLKQLPVTQVKGQVIEFAWPQNLEALPYALNSQAYLLMDTGGKTCIAGATYERAFNSIDADLHFASKDIMPKAEALIPALKGVSILGCKAGIRASTPGHMPIIQKIDSKCWAITGMGSKGLLYHALYSAKLVRMIVNDLRRQLQLSP